MLSLTLELEDGGIVTYDNVTSYTVEEAPSPDEVPEDGDEERGEGNDDNEVDLSEAKNPMDQEQEV